MKRTVRIAVKLAIPTATVKIFSVKISEEMRRESADRQTDRQTHAPTNAYKNVFIICPMLFCIVIGQLTTVFHIIWFFRAVALWKDKELVSK